MKIKSTVQNHLTPIRMDTVKEKKKQQKVTSIGKAVQKLEPL